MLPLGLCQLILALQHRDPAQLLLFGVLGVCASVGLAAKRWA